MKNKRNASIGRISGDNKISIIWLRPVEINRKELLDTTPEPAQPHAGSYKYIKNLGIETISGDNKISII